MILAGDKGNRKIIHLRKSNHEIGLRKRRDEVARFWQDSDTDWIFCGLRYSKWEGIKINDLKTFT